MKRILYIAAALLAGVLVSCNSKEQTTAGEITLTSDDTVTVGVNGGEVQITFKSTTAWRTSVSADAKEWIRVKPAQGEAGDQTVTASVAPNGTTDIRIGSITISTADGKKVNVSVSQDATNTFGISKTTFKDIPAEGQDIEVIVLSNVECKAVSKVDWITVVPPTKAVPELKYTLKVAPNLTVESREGIVEFSAADFDPVEVKVSQVAFEPFITAPASAVMSKDGGELRLLVESNVEWSVTSDTIDDVYIEVEKDGDMVIISMDSNESLQAINFNVYVTADNYEGVSATVAVRQDGIADIVYNVSIKDMGFDVGAIYVQKKFKLAGIGDKLILSTEDKVCLVDAATGAFVKDLDLGDVPHLCMTSDDAGNVLFAGQYAAGETVNIYSTSSVDEAPALALSFKNSGTGNMGNFKIVGDVKGKALLTAIAPAPPYESNGKPMQLESVVVPVENGEAGTPSISIMSVGGMWGPYTGALHPYSTDPADGCFYSGYNSAIQYDLVYTKDYVNYDFFASLNDSGGTCNVNGMDIATMGGKTYLAVPCSPFFKWSASHVDIFDVTDLNSPNQVVSLGAPLYRVTGDNYTDAYGAGDVLLYPGEDGKSLVIYYADLGHDALAKISIPVK